MCINSKERIAVCAEVEGTRGEVFAVLPIALQSQYQRVPNEPIPTYGNRWPQRQSVRLKLETERARRNGDTAMGGRYATRRILVQPAAE